MLEIPSRCLQLGSIKAYVGIVYQIYCSKGDTEAYLEAHISADIIGMNSVISPPRQKRLSKRRPTVNHLSKTQKRLLRTRQRKEILDVIKFFCLDAGCQHVRAECFMANGKLDATPSHQDPCLTMCPVCKGDWRKTFLPVNKQQLVRFLRCKHVSDNLPMIAKGDNIVSLLWEGSEKWRVEYIFGKKSVQRFNVDALFLQLTAAKILVLKHDGDNVLVWDMATTSDPAIPRERINNHEIDKHWDGINLL